MLSVVIVLTCLSSAICTQKCQQENIKYSVKKTTPDFNYKEHVEEGVQISPDGKAFSVTLEQHVPVLCKGALQITHEIYHFYADDKKIEEIESGAFADQNITSQLRLSGNLFTIIRRGTFKNLPITELDLSYNKIGVVEEEAIVNLPHLSILHLSRNLIKELHPTSITQTPQLLFIDVMFNKMERLVEGQFAYMSKDRPTGIGVGISDLVEIHPKAFGDIDIFNLNLTHNKLVTIPSEIFTNYNLTSIDLEHNQLTELDEAFYKSNINMGFFRGNPFDCQTVKKLRLFREVKKIEIFYDEKQDC